MIDRRTKFYLPQTMMNKFCTNSSNHETVVKSGGLNRKCCVDLAYNKVTHTRSHTSLEKGTPSPQEAVVSSIRLF